MVPAFDAEAWLAAPDVGWGERRRDVSSQLMLDLSATPDATLRVNTHGLPLARLYDGSDHAISDDGLARIERLGGHVTEVTVTIRDGETGQPTPARVHLRDAHGRYLPPCGHRSQLVEVAGYDYGADLQLGSMAYAYVPGEFQAMLPAGDIYIEIAKGFEYEPIRQKLSLVPGQRHVDLRIERGLNWRRRGWVSADPHVHFLSPETAWLEAQAEGVHLVGVLATQWGDIFTNVGDVTGEPSGVSRDDTLIWFGTENRQSPLGHIILLGNRGRPIHPLSVGTHGESYPGDAVWATMAEWAEQCRAAGGIAILAHFGNPHSEAVADIVLGKVDAISVHALSQALRGLEIVGIREWYRLLNCGYRVPLMGGTDKMTVSMPMGASRAYTYLGEGEFTLARWMEAVKAGRTFASAGPLLDLHLDGHGIGDEILLDGAGALTVEAHAETVFPFHALEIVVNGHVVARQAGEGPTRSLKLEAVLPLAESGWVAARCLTRCDDEPRVRLSGHTSPIYVTVGGRPAFSRADAQHLLTILQGSLEWLDTLAIRPDREQYQSIRAIFEGAQARLRARLRALLCATASNGELVL